MYDDPAAYDDQQQTQEDDQVHTQPLSQPESAEITDNLWGYLNPCLSTTLQRIELNKNMHEVTIGRNVASNVIFPGFKISNHHAVIRWNGLENANSVVTIEDISSNGTFINGVKIGKGQQRILKDGNEVAFGVASICRDQNGLFDYRFVFRDLVSGVIKRAIYKEYDMSVELGKGSFATVYKALHMKSGEWVAVKVIHETKRQGAPPTTASEAARVGRNKTSSREINIMETLRHPNICMLREVFWNANGSIDLVLELIEGGDLLDFILTNNGLSEPMTQHITYQLCQALSYIHARGITHRDLKPENVLLTKQNPPIVKVADFGLAKIVDSMTMLKTMCGTPSYLAPEVVTQENGNGGYDSLVDSWSVGVILFSMLTNTNPFIETSVEDLKARIRDRVIDWTQVEMLKWGNDEEGYYGVSDEAIDFMHRLLDFDPQRRMTLRDALDHQWLKDYKFVYDIDYPRIANGTDSTTLSNNPSEDVSMRNADQLSFVAPSETDSVSQGFEHLQLSGSSNAILPSASNGEVYHTADDEEGRLTPPSNTPPGLTLHKKGALQRRSEVLQRAVELGNPIVEPSWEMVNYAQSQSQNDDDDLYAPACPANGSDTPVNGSASGSGATPTAPTPNGKGPNKRMHSELTPLPEEEPAEASSASSPLSSISDTPPAPTRKKGRSTTTSREAAGTPSKPKPKRGGRAPTSTRKVKAKVDDEAPAGTRRSTRASTRR